MMNGMRRRLARVMCYLWAAPVTAAGLVIVIVAGRRGRAAVVDGVIEAHGPWLGWALRHLIPLRGGAAAITLGHVVLARDQAAHEHTRAHERVHVRQYERWGVLFIPAYVTAGLWAAARGRHAYFDNPFEREAFDAE
jgi:hypothetical protein